MKLNSAQCRSAKRTVAPWGLRPRNSPSCSQLQQPSFLAKVSTLLPSQGRSSNSVPLPEKAVDDVSSCFCAADIKRTKKLGRQNSLGLQRSNRETVLRRTLSCTTLGRKRVLGVERDCGDISLDLASPSKSNPDFTPRKKRILSSTVSLDLYDSESSLNESFAPTPSTPVSRVSFVAAGPEDADNGGDSFLETIPFDLLVRIVCCLHHDDLHPVFHVSRRLRGAVSIARQLHFNFTTPEREKKGKMARLFPARDDIEKEREGVPFDSQMEVESDGDSFVLPPTPNAPRHVTKPAEAKISPSKLWPFAPPLFQEPPSLFLHSRKLSRLSNNINSHRVLFSEDDLCRAVAQNTI